MARLILLGTSIAASAGLGIADIINQETEGEAFYPSIRTNKAKLKELEPQIEKLRSSYFTSEKKCKDYKCAVAGLAANNQIIAAKMTEITIHVEEIEKKCNEVMKKCEALGTSLPDITPRPFTDAELVLTWGMRGLNFIGIGYQGFAVVRRANHAQAQFRALANHVSNVTKGTNLPTNTLRTVRIGKLTGTIAVLGLAASAASFGIGIKRSEEARDAFKKFVNDAEKQKGELGKGCDDIKQYQNEIKVCHTQCVNDLTKMVNEFLDTPGNALKKKFSDLEKTTDEVKKFQEEIIGELDVLLAQAKAYAKQTQLIISLSPLLSPVASGAIPIDTLLQVARGIDSKIESKEDLKEIIKLIPCENDVLNTVLRKFA